MTNGSCRILSNNWCHPSTKRQCVRMLGWVRGWRERCSAPVSWTAAPAFATATLVECWSAKATMAVGFNRACWVSWVATDGASKWMFPQFLQRSALTRLGSTPGSTKWALWCLKKTKIRYKNGFIYLCSYFGEIKRKRYPGYSKRNNYKNISYTTSRVNSA